MKPPFSIFASNCDLERAAKERSWKEQEAHPSEFILELRKRLENTRVFQEPEGSTYTSPSSSRTDENTDWRN
jgi:transcription elongation GreA/GreB family factor